MKRYLLLLTLLISVSAMGAKTPRIPKGCTVYGQVLCEGRPLVGVAVSDGNGFALTDKAGWYFLKSDKHNGTVFVSIPSGYEVSHQCGMPDFWQPLDREAGLEKHDFSLKKVNNDRHSLLVFTDVHLANIYDDMDQFTGIFMPRIREEVSKHSDTPVYAINLGDSSYDRYWYEDNFTISDWRKTMEKVDFPVPVFTAIGNHDNDGAVQDGANTDFAAAEPYRKVMGPNWYSFNLGKVHYVVLDNVVYKNSEGRIDDCKGIAGKRDYDTYVTEEQMQWLREDLDLIGDRSTPVVLAFHVPVIKHKGGDTGRIVGCNKVGGAPCDSLVNAFTALLKDFEQVHYLTGHTHKNLVCRGCEDTSTFPYIANTIEHNITGVCGCWWQTRSYGGPSLSTDGAPTGFEVFDIDGKDLCWYFVSNDDGADVQFRVFDLNAVRDYYSERGEARSLLAHHPAFRDFSKEKDNMVLVNVWAWESNWRVSVTENGVELPLTHKRFENPQFTLAYSLPKMAWRDLWPTKEKSPALHPHMFLCQASSPSSTIIVTVTDGFGRSWSQLVERPKAFSKDISEKNVLIPGSESTLTESPYDRFGGVYHPYVHGDGGHTDAPEGYEPFYISHVGRHGSRYPVDHSYLMHGMSSLVACNEKGLLSEQGSAALRAYEVLDSISTGVYGLIDATGAAEHRGIAERMYERYAGVFHQADRDSIFVQSTHRQRCIMSSWNFCTVLQGKVPVKMGLVAGEKYYDILSNAETPEISARNKVYNHYSDTFALAHFDFDGMFNRLFNDAEAARPLVKSPRTLLENMYSNGTVARYLGYDDLYNVLLPEEYEFAGRNYAGKMNCQHCGSAENGDFRLPFARPLLNDIIARADAALESNGLAADLRFSHDTGLMPFFALIGLDGFDRNYNYQQAFDNWDATRLMCMATNLQLIFYRNAEGDMLVKILHNERETSIPALGDGPFYEWAKLREYLSGKL